MRRFLFGLMTTAGFVVGLATEASAVSQEDLGDVQEVVEAEPEPIPGYESVPLVRLSDVLASPDAFHSTPFRFTGQFFGFGEVYSPFYTIFEPGQFYNFAAWGGDASIWHRKDFISPHALLYMNRKNRNQAQSLLRLGRFDRFHAVGIVRSAFRSQAWIEITTVHPLPSKLNRQTLTNFVHGYRLKNAGEFDLASLRFAEACDQNTPVFARKAARLEEGRCLMAAGEFQEAVQVFARGMREFPNTLEFRELHTQSVASGRAGVGAKRAQKELLDVLTSDDVDKPSPTQDLGSENVSESMTNANETPPVSEPVRESPRPSPETEEPAREPTPPSSEPPRDAMPMTEPLPKDPGPPELEETSRGVSDAEKKALEDQLPLIDKTDLKGPKNS